MIFIYENAIFSFIHMSHEGGTKYKEGEGGFEPVRLWPIVHNTSILTTRLIHPWLWKRYLINKVYTISRWEEVPQQEVENRDIFINYHNIIWFIKYNKKTNMNPVHTN